MHGQDGPSHNEDRYQLRAASASQPKTLKTYACARDCTPRRRARRCRPVPGLRDARHSAVIGAWSQCDELLRESLPRLRIERRPASVDPNVATALRPPEFLESVPECRHVGM